MGLKSYFQKRKINSYLTNIQELLDELEIKKHDQYMGFNMVSSPDAKDNGYNTYTYRSWERNFKEYFENITGIITLAAQELEKLRAEGFDKAQLEQLEKRVDTFKKLLQEYAQNPKKYFKIVAARDPHFAEYTERGKLQASIHKKLQ